MGMYWIRRETLAAKSMQKRRASLKSAKKLNANSKTELAFAA